MKKKRRCLIAFTHVGVMTAAQLPSLLKRAGYHVSMMGKARRKLSVSQHYDKWYSTSDDPREIITTIANILRNDPTAYEWIILAGDPLLRVLNELNFPSDIMARISPVRNLTALSILGSKTRTAAFLQDNGITVPQFLPCTEANEITAAAHALGYPLIAKVDQSQNGSGVFKCFSDVDINRHAKDLVGVTLQLEKLIEGEQIGVEPLYMNGVLLAYCSAKIIATDTVVGLETRRQTIDEPALIPILKHLGKVLELHGFCNLGFMRSPDGQLYLFEADLRPNAWVTLDAFYGVHFAEAIRQHNLYGSQTQELQTPKAGRDVCIFHREITQYFRERNWRGLWQGMTNNNNCWRFIPADDPSFVIRTLARILIAPYFHSLKRCFSRVKI